MRNTTLSEEGLIKFAWLEIDNKPICRTRYTNFPLEVSYCWEIHGFVPCSECRELNLPGFQLFAAPESSHEITEWTTFMNFLSSRNKAAIVKMKSYSLYLLAPDKCQKFTHVNVVYKIEKLPCVVEMSGRSSDQEKNSADDSKSNFNELVGGDFTAAADGSTVSSMRKSGPGRSAMIHPSYLKTLSQTHVWAFGALAELIDNSRDARAPRLAISVEPMYISKIGGGVPVLSVVDDGIGMSHNDIVRMLTVGHKSDNENHDRIGCFGVGFKSGAMKLGKDVLVLTQTTGSRSVALFSQSFNEHKKNVEIPIITYRKIGSFMEIDLSIHSENDATSNLNAVKEFSPFNEYLLGERLGLFGAMGTGTQIYIWNLEKWGLNYSLEWVDSKKGADGSSRRGDILIRSRRVRSRAGQISQKVPLDYSLQAYLKVNFLDPRMEMIVQGSMVKSRPLVKSLNETSVVNGTIMGKMIQLTLGKSNLEWERMNGGVFLYWHGRLIESYKRVGGMVHNADIGRGVIGVVDVSDLMDGVNGNVYVLNNKQGFQDCELYVLLEEWLGNQLDEYWDKHFDKVDLVEDKETKRYKPDHEWVQCDKCRKWRILDPEFSSDLLPSEWFCYMAPFNGKCETPQQDVEPGIITIGTKRFRRPT